jgi:hypothetical protein
MTFQRISPSAKSLLLTLAVFMLFNQLNAQVNAVEFGKNRVQFRKFKWENYQSDNFNVYFYENGKTIANFIIQTAEAELEDVERKVEYALQRRANIIVYNSYNEYEQSNIGLGNDWQSPGGITKLVNNKIIVYFTSDHEALRRQIREGIARVLVDNLLFGDDLGEFAANQALLDLPKWMTDGYIRYIGEGWTAEKDDELKSALLSGEYKNFYHFAYERPLLAGQAFWKYISDTYKPENVTYFLYLARAYKNINNASLRITKKKYKTLLDEFMQQTTEKYYADLKGRKNFPKGTISITEETSKTRDYIRFAPNPIARSQTYAVVEYIKGKNQVVLWEDMIDRRVLLKYGVRTASHEINPNYPLLAWDPKGALLACIYWEEGKIKLFVYDVVGRYKKVKQVLTQFEQIQDVKFMLNNNTLLMSAVKNGQSDIFIYDIEKDTYEQVTNDAYADVDPSFVAFPNKQGIIFASNRPDPYAAGGDTVSKVAPFNIFLADYSNKSDFRQITQLTKMTWGNARSPVQYNTTHFTFVSNENGIANRYAGFFNSENAGVDTVYVIGDEVLRNADDAEIAATLKTWGKEMPDSVYVYSVTRDSAYTFPITNYQSSLLETKIAGEQGLVSEVRQEGNLKFLYKLKVDERALERRNINPAPTLFRKQQMAAKQVNTGRKVLAPKKAVSNDFGFETEFEPAAAKPVTDTAKPPVNNAVVTPRADFNNFGNDKVSLDDPNYVLKSAKRFDYRFKFSTDNITAGFNNDVLVNRYQVFTGSLPINLQNNSGFNGMLKATVVDLFEDLKFTGALRLPIFGGGGGAGASIGGGGVGVFVPSTQSLFNGGGEWFGRIDYLKHRFDYSLVYYRQTQQGSVTGVGGTTTMFEGKQFTNLYQVVVKYPFDKVRSLRLSTGIRMDRTSVKGAYGQDITLKQGDFNKQNFLLTKLEYVYDDAVIKANNILNGLRYKAYMDVMTQVSKPDVLNSSPDIQRGKLSFNFGFDARYYKPIYRTFIYALRAAGDFSWGNQKMIYYLGGMDGWIGPKYNTYPQPQGSDYAFQSLAVNMRGHRQNVGNGNNALVINSEFRLPVFQTLLDRPINNAFVRNFQLTQFIDLGTAWNGSYSKIERPYIMYTNPGDDLVAVRIRPGGIGPFVGGYGFGVRSTLLGYFLKLDAGWEMDGFFKGKPLLHFSFGLDF